MIIFLLLFSDISKFNINSPSNYNFRDFLTKLTQIETGCGSGSHDPESPCSIIFFGEVVSDIYIPNRVLS